MTTSTNSTEIVNPANGSLSIRIEAPRPKERGLNYPLYSFLYDSTQQFTFHYQEATGGSYNCGADSAGDNNISTTPPQPLNCIMAVSFPYVSVSYAAGGINGVLSGPNSMIANGATFSRWATTTSFKTCDLYTGYSYEDPYGVIHDLGAYNILTNNSSTGYCTYLGISDSPVGGDEQYKLVVNNANWNLSFPPNGSFTSGGGVMIDVHGNAAKVISGTGSLAALPMEDVNGNAVSGTGRSGTYQSFQPWGDALASPKTASRTFAGGATYNYTWGTATTHFNPTSVDVSTILQIGGRQTLCAPPQNYGSGTTNPVVSTMQEPDGLNYIFTYDPTYGLLSKITYPTGAWVQYTWGVNHLSDATGWSTPPSYVNYFNDPVHYPVGGTTNTSCMFEHDTPAVVKRVVSYDGVNAAEEQDFSYSTTWQAGSSGVWTSKQTIVTTKDLLSAGTPSFQTIYTYSPWITHSSIGNHLTSSGLTLEKTIVYKDTHGNVLRTVTKAWNSYIQLTAECTTLPSGKTSGKFYQYEPYPIPGGLAPASVPGVSTTNLFTDVAEYDYGLVTTPCQKPTTTPTKETVTTYANFANTPLWPSFNYPNGTISMPPIPDRPATIIQYQNGTKVSEADFNYDETALASVSTPVGHDETNYGSGLTATRGNPTTVTRKCFQATGTCSDSITKIAYDTTGQPVSATDANNNTTTLSYVDNYTTDDGSPTGNTNTYVTTITRPTTNSVSHIEHFQWDFNKGQLRTVTDENNNQTSYLYADPWWRLTQTTFPDLGSVNHTYQDAGPNPSVTTSTLISTGNTMQSKTVMDAAGHVIQTQFLSDPEGVDYVDTVYDGLGRVYSISNPYRTTSDSTYGITTYGYDSLNRKTLQLQSDGGLLQWCYDSVASSSQTNCSANASTKTNTTWVDSSDEIGNHWQRAYDAFDRLMSVMEPNGTSTSPSMETDYAYDGLNDLVGVTQNGNNSANARVRTFAYDSLGRLYSAANPESGTITYTYDGNSNLISRLTPRAGQTGTAQTTTSYTYDALNRLTLITHLNPNTTKQEYSYDGTTLTGCPQPSPPVITGAANLVGRRSATCAAKSASSYSYDVMGRVTTESSKYAGTATKTFNISYSYYKDGSVNTITYPSGDVTTYTVGSAGRVTQVADAANSFVGYAGHPATYAPTGALASMLSGHTASFAGIATSNTYNKRLQPILLSAGISGGSSIFSLCYDFHLGSAISSAPCSFSAYATGNNGNVFQAINNLDSTRSAVFSYDTLNRIKQAATIATTGANCWGETYTIDAWGNLTNRGTVSGMSGCATEALNAAPATIKNQLTGIAYDAAGNVTNDGVGNQPTYDPENRIATDAAVSYYYDADGIRVQKTSGTMYLPGLSGEILTETDLSGSINEEYIYFNNQRIARVDRPSGAAHYYFSDHLGSASVLTDAGGNIQERYYYYPYGGSVASIGTDPNHYKFGGKERDSESGLDYFEARHYASALGRFVQPDEFRGGPIDLFESDEPASQAVPYANIWNPQSLNKYAYTYNNPLRYIDPNGHGGPGLLEAPVVEETIVGETIAAAEVGAEEGAEVGTVAEPGGGTVAGAIIGGVVAGGGVLGTYEYKKHFSDPGPPPGPPAPKPPGTVPSPQMAEHKSGARKSTKGRHQSGTARKRRDRGGEKGDERRRPPRKRPDDWKGPWPPKPPKPPSPPKHPGSER